MSVPTLEQFKDACREAFDFLTTEYSFQEIPVSQGRHGNPFVVRYSNGALAVIIEGGNYGSTASVCLEDVTGRTAEFGYIEMRDLAWDQYWTFGEGGQLRSIALSADRLRTLGARLLSGDMSDFEWILQQQARDAENAAWEDELRPLRRAARDADDAFTRRDFQTVVRLLTPFAAQLSELHRRKLLYATKNA